MMSIKANLITPKKIGLYISFIFLFLYFFTLPKINTGYGDSDEFLVVGSTWGTAHSPGYPLYVTLLHGAMSIPLPYTTPSQRAYMVSAIAAATALYISSLFLFDILDQITISLRKKNQIPSWLKPVSVVITLISCGTSSLFWTHTQTSEKYIFTAPFIAFLMYTGNRILHTNQSNNKRPLTLYLFSITFGVLMSHLQSMLFLIPYVGFIFYKSKIHLRPKLLAYNCIAILTSFILPYLLLVVRVAATPAVTWYLQPTMKGLIQFIFHNDFRGEISSASLSAVSYFPSVITLNQIISGITKFSSSLGNSFSWWIILPMIAAVADMWKKQRSQIIEISLPLILLGLIQAAVLNWPADNASQSVVYRHYVVSTITFLPLICVGLYIIFARFWAGLSVLSNRICIKLTPVIVFALLPIMSGVIKYSLVQLNQITVTSQLYSQIITSTAQNSILTCFTTRSCYALLYEQQVNHLRPDVKIIPSIEYIVQNNVSAHQYTHFAYDRNPWVLMDLVTWNLDKTPVYAVDLTQEYYSQFGIGQGYLFYVPLGYYGQFSRSMPNQIPSYDDTLTRNAIKNHINSHDPSLKVIIQSLEQIHFTNGSIVLAMGSRDNARQEVTKGVNLSYLLEAVDKDQAQATRLKIEKGLFNPSFAPGSKVPTATSLLKTVPDLYQRQKNMQAYKTVLGAVMIEPMNIDARLELARIYSKMGDSNMMQTEYKNVLIIDPQNTEALNKLGSTIQ